MIVNYIVITKETHPFICADKKKDRFIQTMSTLGIGMYKDETTMRDDLDFKFKKKGLKKPTYKKVIT